MAYVTPASRRGPAEESNRDAPEAVLASDPAATAAAADRPFPPGVDLDDEPEVLPPPLAPPTGKPPSDSAAPAPFGSRREARERALSLLYEADAKSIAPAALLDEIPVDPPPYVTSLVAGVGERQAQIDELIARYAIDWTIDRMPVVDRMVVRIASFELLCRPDVPTGVVISEAVELAKRYSTDESGRFVNGLLASISAEIRPTV